MKKPILIIMLFAFTVIAKAQVKKATPDTSLAHNSDATTAIDVSNEKVDPNKIYSAVDRQPMFPGNLRAYFKKNQKLPAQAASGRVIAQFVVEADGTLSNIKILISPGDIYSAEAVRLLKNSPKWQPGIIKGQAIRCYFTAPINFGDDN
jgi:outer membrane biosynthesis protein TonB